MPIFSSNIINILITCLFAYGVSFVPKYILINLFKILSVLISVLIIYSYIFNIGDVVYIFKYYKRAFFVFDDGINISLIFLYYILLLNKNIIYSQIALIAFLMALGKMAIILIMICLAFLLINNKDNRKKILIRFLTTFFIAILFIFSSGKLTFHLYDNDYGGVFQARSMIGGDLKNNLGSYKYSAPAYNDCDVCFITSPFRIRMLSMIAGAWMTAQGGFPREQAVSSPEEFADLIYNANPYNINDRLNLTYDDWLIVSGVHNSYLGIGSSYGPIALAMLVIFIAFIIVISWKNKNDSYFYNVCFSYFIVITIFNQSQQYIQAYNLELIVLSFCGSYIFNKTYNLLPDIDRHDNCKAS